MLDYLVTSRTRRELLRRLWLDGGSGNVSALAHSCGVSFAAAHRELEAMKAAGLARAERRGTALEYRADHRHPQARALVSLLTPPVAVDVPAVETRPSAEDDLVDLLVASHADESAALGLPAIFWRQREQLDRGRLTREATRRDERQALGLFLQLTGQLSGDRRLTLRASFLRDRRRTVLRPYFSPGVGASADKPLPLARRWGYLMSIDLDRFADAFKRELRRVRG